MVIINKRVKPIEALICYCGVDCEYRNVKNI